MTAKDALKLAGDDLAITVNDGGPQALRRRSSFMDTIKGELLADSEADTAAKESKVSTDFSEEHARGKHFQQQQQHVHRVQLQWAQRCDSDSAAAA